MKHGITKEMSEKWAEKTLKEYMESEEYQKDKIKMERDFLNFVIYGKATRYFDENNLETLRTNYLDLDTIIKRYSLTEKEIEDLKKIRDVK